MRDTQENRAHWAQESPSDTVVEFSEPHEHNDGTYGFDVYEFDRAGRKIREEHGWQLEK